MTVGCSVVVEGLCSVVPLYCYTFCYVKLFGERDCSIFTCSHSDLSHTSVLSSKFTGSFPLFCLKIVNYVVYVMPVETFCDI